LFVFFGLFSYGRCIASDYLFGIKLWTNEKGQKDKQ
jgi:hypothetical protein